MANCIIFQKETFEAELVKCKKEASNTQAELWEKIGLLETQISSLQKSHDQEKNEMQDKLVY